MRYLLLLLLAGCTATNAIKAQDVPQASPAEAGQVQDWDIIDRLLVRNDNTSKALTILKKALQEKSTTLSRVIVPFAPVIRGRQVILLLQKEYREIVPLLKSRATDQAIAPMARIMAAGLLGSLSGGNGAVRWKKGELVAFMANLDDDSKGEFLEAFRDPRKEEIIEIFRFFSENPLPKTPWDATVVTFVSSHVLFDTSVKYPLSTEEALRWMKEVTADRDSFSYHEPSGLFFQKSLLARPESMQAPRPKGQGVPAQSAPVEGEKGEEKK